MKREWMGAARLGVVLFLLYLAIHYWGTLSSLLLLGLGAAFPLVLGAVIAYAVNILMSLYEGWYFPDTKSPFVIKSRRPVCLLLAFASLIAIVFLLIRMILPELLECTLVLIQEVVPMLEKLSENLDLSQFFSISSTALADGSINWKEVITSITQWLVKGVGGVMGSVLSLVSATVSTAFTAVVSIIFSIYLLLGKEKLGRQISLVMKTYLKPAWYSHLVYFLETLHSCFRRFVVGQCTEAVILGLLCMGGMMLLRFPYASMVGALIGFTALIPVAGACIGAGVGAFMIFTVSPFQSLFFLIFIAILQLLEGNLI